MVETIFMVRHQWRLDLPCLIWSVFYCHVIKRLDIEYLHFWYIKSHIAISLIKPNSKFILHINWYQIQTSIMKLNQLNQIESNQLKYNQNNKANAHNFSPFISKNTFLLEIFIHSKKRSAHAKYFADKWFCVVKIHECVKA